MKKPYENSTDYDPGRFRYRLTFFQRVITKSPSIGQTESWTQLVTKRAIREIVPKRLSLDGFIQDNAGSTDLYEMWHFTIRYTPSFIPKKDMAISCGSDIYTIKQVSEIDEPRNYYKILCVKTDLNLTT